MGRRPDFLIIGAMKSATTSLYRQLRLQNGIFMPELKEPNFFSDDENFNRGPGWYENLFEGACKDDLCGEASTHYTKQPTYPRTLERMQEAVPEARLIYVMRNPVDRLISQYVHQWTQREISCGLDEAVQRHPELIAYSRYAFQIAPYIEAFGRDAVLPVFFEDLKTDPQIELERICRFIGYQRTPAWQQDLKPDNVSSGRIRQFPLYRFIVEAPLAAQLRRALVPESVRRLVRRRLTMRERPQLSAESMDVLDEEFTKDLAELSRLLGCDVSLDGRNAAVFYNRIMQTLPRGPMAEEAQ